MAIKENMKKKMKIRVSVDPSKVPNKMHLEIQQHNKVQVFKPKKGKGSFKRNKRVEGEY